MRNKKLYPFERNNYFYGKLLTVRDFEDEQRYMNDKRRLTNILNCGVGVVSGLNTLMIDEKTISIEAGMALDYMGREIIVEEAVTKKLNVIDGFDGLQDIRSIYLCLEYEEKSEEMVHSIVATSENNNQEAQYNRVNESYRLYLTNEEKDSHSLTLNHYKEDKQVIYEANGIKITQIVPLYTQPEKEIEVKVQIEKINLPRMVDMEYTLTSDYFFNDEGENKLTIHYRDEDVTAYKTVELTYKLRADQVEQVKASLFVDKATSSISIGTVHYSLEEDTYFNVEIAKTSINERIIKAYMETPFDEALNFGSNNAIYLAKMRLIKKGVEYSIDDFQPMPYKQYVLSNGLLQLLMPEEVEQGLNAKELQKYLAGYDEVAVSKADGNNPKSLSSGQEVIEIDLRSKNKVYFSDEIAHGLGKGDVLINVAVVEELKENSSYDHSKNIFGDISILEGTHFEPNLPKCSLAVISYIETGTFRIAIKCLDNAETQTITVKWWAEKDEKARKENLSEINHVTVEIEPNTITIAPREKYKFTSVIEGTDNKECRWAVADKEGGAIDFNGVYEAPTKEGVYEISAESVKYPMKKATAFVVVKEG